LAILIQNGEIVTSDSRQRSTGNIEAGNLIVGGIGSVKELAFGIDGEPRCRCAGAQRKWRAGKFGQSAAGSNGKS